VGKSERVVTMVVLLVASVQIVLTRPRADPSPVPSETAAEVSSAGQPAPSFHRFSSGRSTRP
jgi:hypothetical protein